MKSAVLSFAATLLFRALPWAVCAVYFVAPAVLADAAGGPWWEQIALEADLRLRHESIRREPGDNVGRERYRARFGFTVDPGDSLELGVRLATGEGDPGSTNLNFGESVSLDNIRLDRAYVAWSASDALKLTAGKMKNPFFLAGDTALMWDGDFNPAGLAAKYEAGAYFARVGAFRLDYRDEGPASRVFGGQVGAAFDASESSTVTVGVGWFDFTDIAGHSPLYRSNARGNSLDAAGDYRNDYDIVELFLEYETRVRRWPVAAFAEWARNTRVAGADTAYSIGVNFGKADEPGMAEWSWEWRDTEADALVGILTDSDLADGNTASRGHVLKGSYRLTGQMSIGGTLIFSEYWRDGSSTDFDRLMLDIAFEF